MRTLTASIGGRHNAKVKKTWRGTWERFCELMLARVPETMDKASVGWVCGAEFDPEYRDSENFVARHFLTFDYDHITPEDYARILAYFSGHAALAYTTWSHVDNRPRLRLWMPMSRPCGYDEFQAISRRVASGIGIELAARESHVPSQYMFRPAVKPFEEFKHWTFEGPWVDVDKILGEYDDWTDRSSWPHRIEGDGVHSEGSAIDPRTKPGIVGAFCRAFSISEAIGRFDLPYVPSGTEGRWTYTAGSRPEGAIVYDDDQKLHSHHDTDAARGQSNSYDLVRLHKFGNLDRPNEDLPLGKRPSSIQMARFAAAIPEVRTELAVPIAGEFEDLDILDAEYSWDDRNAEAPAGREPAGVELPRKIVKAASKLTDQENARRIQRQYSEKLVSIGKSFFFWTGTHWAQSESKAFGCVTHLSAIVKAEHARLQEETDAAVLARGSPITAEEEARLGGLWRWAIECGQSAKLNNCRNLLRDLLDFPAESLNRAAHLFSCSNGTLDLKTGLLTPHDPKNFITACSPFAYDPGAQAPRFERFLSEIFDGNEELVAFAKRWFGYCITGDVSEQKMLFHIGPGGNGKSTLMDLLRHVLGSDYYSTAAPGLLVSETQGATPELADLLGRRMVTIAETEESMELREGLVKQITGGDPIKARMLYKDLFAFLPTHKLQVFTNFAPRIKGQDFAIWRRILLLDYPVKYGDAAAVARGEAHRLEDPLLEASLQAEAQGVLRWLVEGAKEWYLHRLNPPAAILKATKDYRAKQDLIGQFVDERLVVAPEARCALAGTVGSVFTAYRGWCSSMGCHPMARPRFSAELIRVVPSAKLTSWLDGELRITGFEGIKLAQSDFLD